MKNKIVLLTSLISVGLLTSATAFAGNGGGGQRGGGAGTPVRDGSGQSINRGNPNSTGTPLQDGSGRATAPGKGAKDGTGTQAGGPKT